MQGESNSKAGRGLSYTKITQGEWKEDLFLLSRVQCILYTKIREKNDTINYQTSPIPFSLIKINPYCLHIIIIK